jgi:hypothetical protein
MFCGTVPGRRGNRERKPDGNRCSLIQRTVYTDLILPFAVAVQAEKGV